MTNASVEALFYYAEDKSDLIVVSACRPEEKQREFLLFH